MSNFHKNIYEQAILYGWHTRNYSLYYGFPIVKPEDVEDIFIGVTGGRLDLVPAHFLWSNLSENQKLELLDKVKRILKNGMYKKEIS